MLGKEAKIVKRGENYKIFPIKPVQDIKITVLHAAAQEGPDSP